MVLLFLVAWHALASAVAFGLYAWDKRMAVRGGWRVPESTLLGVGLLGGWPGAWMAQTRLRHKTVKPSFQWRFKATVALHGVALLALLAWVARAWVPI